MLQAHVKKLISHRSLLWLWTLREIRVRYKQSVLGILWVILQPLSMMVVLTVVFSVFARVPSDGLPYPVFSLTGLIPWIFLSNALNGAVTSLTANTALVQKVAFPREVLPIGVAFAALFDLAVASLILAPLFLFYSVSLSAALLWLPVLVLVQFLLILGCAFPAAALCVRFRDLRFVVPLGLQIWLFASPVIYPASLVPDSYRWVYMLNPMAFLIESYRRVSLRGSAPQPLPLLISLCLVTVLVLVGYWYFKRSEPKFADII